MITFLKLEEQHQHKNGGVPCGTKLWLGEKGRTVNSPCNSSPKSGKMCL